MVAGTHTTNPKWQTAAVLKISKLPYLPNRSR